MSRSLLGFSVLLVGCHHLAPTNLTTTEAAQASPSQHRVTSPTSRTSPNPPVTTNDFTVLDAFATQPDLISDGRSLFVLGPGAPRVFPSSVQLPNFDGGLRAINPEALFVVSSSQGDPAAGSASSTKYRLSRVERATGTTTWSVLTDDPCWGWRVTLTSSALVCHRTDTGSLVWFALADGSVQQEVLAPTAIHLSSHDSVACAASPDSVSCWNGTEQLFQHHLPSPVTALAAHSGGALVSMEDGVWSLDQEGVSKRFDIQGTTAVCVDGTAAIVVRNAGAAVQLLRCEEESVGCRSILDEAAVDLGPPETLQLFCAQNRVFVEVNPRLHVWQLGMVNTAVSPAPPMAGGAGP